VSIFIVDELVLFNVELRNRTKNKDEVDDDDDDDDDEQYSIACNNYRPTISGVVAVVQHVYDTL